MTIRDTIIIGSGPAGYTAAIYAARANLSPLVIEGWQHGGALTTTTDVENFPGFPDGIMGSELMENLRAQALRFGAELISEDADEVSLNGTEKRILAGGKTYSAYTVVLAMGAASLYLGVPGEQELIGRGVSTCATCDGFFYRGKKVAVIGGGDSAMEEATFLSRFASEVTIIHRRDQFRASPVMLDRARADEKVGFRTAVQVAEVVGDNAVDGLLLKSSSGSELLKVDGVFVAIGHQPRNALVAGQVELDDDGYVRVSSPKTDTSVAGVFAAGDLVDKHYRQAITAAGSGCAAALDAQRYLERFSAQRR